MLLPVCVHHRESAPKSQPLYHPNANSGTLHFSPRSQEQGHSAHIPGFKSSRFKNEREMWGLWCRPPSETGGCREAPSSCEDPRQLGSVLQMLGSCSALGCIRWLASYYWSLGRPASDFRALSPNFFNPGLLKYFVYLAAVVPIAPKLFFLLNYRGFELEQTLLYKCVH